MFGARTSGVVAGKIIGSARDSGINFIDTADGYSKGESERIVGKSIRRDRVLGCWPPRCGTRWAVDRMTVASAESTFSKRWMEA